MLYITLSPVEQSYDETFACLLSHETLKTLVLMGLSFQIAPSSVRSNIEYTLAGATMGAAQGAVNGAIVGAVVGDAVSNLCDPDKPNKCKLEGEIKPSMTPKGWKMCQWRCTGWTVRRYWPVETPCPDNIYPAPGWRNPQSPCSPGDTTPMPPIEWS